MNYAVKYILLLLLILLFGCNAADDKATPLISSDIKPSRPNVILISLDTVRTDHLSCYGYPKPTTPNIDNLARDGILFTKAIAQSSWTLPSHVSIMTSLYPDVHQIYGRDKRLGDKALTLAEILKLYGYRTAAFSGGFDVHSRHGLAQGFDIYQHNESWLGGFNQTVPQAVNWLKSEVAGREQRIESSGRRTPDAGRPSLPFFLFLHGYDAHIPGPDQTDEIIPAWNNRKWSTVRPEIKRALKSAEPDWKDLSPTMEEIEYVIAHYDTAINRADKQIGQFLNALKQMNLYDNTLIAIFSDHGESFDEHKNENYLYVNKNNDNLPLTLSGAEHGNVYEEGIRVPLIIKLPHQSVIHNSSFITHNLTVDAPVQLIDVMPTILDYAGIPIPHQAQGQSLKPLINETVSSDFNKPAPNSFSGYVFSNGALGKDAPYRALVRTNQWKLIYVETEENVAAGLVPSFLPERAGLAKRQCKVTAESRPKRESLAPSGVPAHIFILFDLVNDPAETKNVVSEHPEITTELKEQLFKWLEQNRSVNGSKQNLTVSIPTGMTPQLQKEISRAGYWSDSPDDKSGVSKLKEFESQLITLNDSAANLTENFSLPASGFNVIWIVIGSLRADHLQCYGYNRKTTPNIDALAKEGIIFTQAIGQSYWTLPSHTSMLTSQYPSTHGVWERGQSLQDKALTLPEILKMYGYETTAFTGGLDLNSINNLNQGFDSYYDKKSLARSADLVPLVVDWLDARRKTPDTRPKTQDAGRTTPSPFFLYLHTYDGHSPYDAVSEPDHHMFDENYRGIFDRVPLSYDLLKNIKNSELSLKDKNHKLNADDFNHVVAHYDSSIFYADQQMGILVAKLKESGLFENSLIILTADHGEELGDHGSFDRFGAQNLYDEVIHVPLIIKLPNNLTSRIPHSPFSIPHSPIDTPVQLIDIMPTTLDLLKIPLNQESQGQSLLPLMTERTQSQHNNLNQEKNDVSNFKYSFAEANEYKQTIRAGEWKLIRKVNKTRTHLFKELPKLIRDDLDGFDSNPKEIINVEVESYELYNLTKDRGESKECSRENPGVVYALLQKLLEFIRTVRIDQPLDKKELPALLIEELKKHGYWESK
ncbi:MAG: sulfatase-like hydrolase/transferase [Planctomycetota bacterium]